MKLYAELKPHVILFHGSSKLNDIIALVECTE